MRYEIWRNLDENLANTRINLHDIIYNYANLLGAKFDVLNLISIKFSRLNLKLFRANFDNVSHETGLIL